MAQEIEALYLEIDKSLNRPQPSALFFVSDAFEFS